MRTVTYRLERIEQLVAQARCGVCRGRPTIRAFREDEPPPPDVRCRCGRGAMLWRSQAPPEVDEAFARALERSDSYTVPLPTRGRPPSISSRAGV